MLCKHLQRYPLQTVKVISQRLSSRVTGGPGQKRNGIDRLQSLG